MIERLRQEIAAAGGWISFGRYMEMALQAYYGRDDRQFGAAGDFVTAPELGRLFGRTLARQLRELEGPILELGAGTGALAETLLAEEPFEYFILETSAALRARQAARLGAGVMFLERLPQKFRGVVLANEVVDALPVERFRIGRSRCEALGVIATSAGFSFEPRAAGAALSRAVGALQAKLPSPMPPGFVSELRLGQGDWIAAAVRSMTRGAMLVVDYGLPRSQYYHPSRDGGTLCAFRRHRRVEDVLAHPGLQDLTAWVDFSALAESAAACGLEVGGFATQAHFLVSTGIERELARLAEAAGERERLALRQSAATLLLPGEMGERFKAMALARGIRGPFDGFGFRDLSASL